MHEPVSLTALPIDIYIFGISTTFLVNWDPFDQNLRQFLKKYFFSPNGPLGFELWKIRKIQIAKNSDLIGQNPGWFGLRDPLTTRFWWKISDTRDFFKLNINILIMLQYKSRIFCNTKSKTVMLLNMQYNFAIKKLKYKARVCGVKMVLKTMWLQKVFSQNNKGRWHQMTLC